VAGGDPAVAVGLGLAMVALQAGIGATNDIVDAPRDAGRKPGKPIPAGLVERRTALGVSAGAFGLGVALSLATAGGKGGILAAIVIAIGLGYDLRFKGTPWSWLPFAVGIPVLPVFGWFGATGGLPSAFIVLVPAAIAAGAALAIGNALVDIERDRDAGSNSVALVLGPERAWLAQLALILIVSLAAVASLPWLGGSVPESGAVALVALVPVVAAIAARGGGAGRRERAWELEAVGMAALGVAWVLVALS
jgi:4-hydroxybenzoate polyprenyltransferase